MTHLTKATVILSLTAMLAGSPAFAGEITGTGEYTPVHGHIASSICSFSGLNDDASGPNSLVQSYGAIRAAFGGPAPFNGLPGVECRGN